MPSVIGGWRIIGAAFALSASVSLPAHAERIENKVAVFSALDKVTARISKFEVELGQSVTFGALRVTPRVCYSRPPTEEPKTTTFVEVVETQLDGSEKSIFTGWMFAESPGIYGLEHPTYDVWLTECEKPKTPTVSRAPAPAAPVASRDDAYVPPSAESDAQVPADNGDFAPEVRRRVRR